MAHNNYMARLSFGSQHFSTTSSLLKKDAERIATAVPSSPASASCEECPILTVNSHHEEDLQSENSATDREFEPTKLKNLSAQVLILSRSNDRLVCEVSALKEENRRLSVLLEQLRERVELGPETSLVSDLESSVVASFAKILNNIHRLKQLPALEHRQHPPVQKDESDLPAAPASSLPPNSILTSKSLTNRATPAVKTEDYLSLTFFKPVQRKSFLLSRSPSDSSPLLRLKTPFVSRSRTFQSESIENTAPHGVFGVPEPKRQYTGKVSDIMGNEQHLNPSLGLLSSTPQKKAKKSTIIDIYGDEISLRRKRPTRSSESAGPASGTQPARDAESSVRQPLANVTNKHRKRPKRKPQPELPVDSDFFDYVDEKKLTEQTQQSVAHVKNRFQQGLAAAPREY